MIKRCKGIVITAAMDVAIDTLETNSFVGVRGDAHSGKTCVLYGVMKVFKDKHRDWRVIRLKQEDHLRACYNKEKVLLVMDDILEDDKMFILKCLGDVKTYIHKGCWKFLFSYSNESYKKNLSREKKVSMLDGGYVLNISTQHKCTDDENIKILNSCCESLGYELPMETSMHCVKLVPAKYFFSYVKRYISNKEDMVECSSIYFFQNPIEEMIRDLDDLKTKNLHGFCILFCCSTLSHSSFSISDQFQKQLKEPTMEILKWLLGESYNEDHSIDVQRLERAVRDVPKAFIEQTENNQYRIKFACVLVAVKLIIFNSLALNDNDNLFKHFLSLCDLTLLRQFVQSDQSVSMLKKHNKFPHLVERFVAEITNGNVEKVCDNPLFSNDDFKRAFISKFRSICDDKYTWEIVSKLDKNTGKALIVYAVLNDTSDSEGNLANYILGCKLWKKYSRKEGGKVDRQLLVLQQNTSALKSKKGLINERFSTHRTLIDSVLNNVWKISKWMDIRMREEAIRCVIEVQALVLSETSTGSILERENRVLKLFQKIKMKEHINEKKQSLLQLCVTCTNTRFLEWAIEQRKDEINRTDSCGQTPLHTAVQEQNVCAVRFLIKFGAVIEIKDKDGDSALHLAVHKNKEILNILIRVNGTDVNVINKHGKTPLQLARELQKTEHVQILELADVNYE